MAESAPVLKLDGSSVTLDASDAWLLEQRGSEICLRRKVDRDGNTLRRLHIEMHRGQATTLEDAVHEEMDRITERAGPKGSSNDRRSFQGISPFQTYSGIDGIRADFFFAREGERQHTITKYYFFDDDGRIFRVCAHIIGDDDMLSEFEDVIRSGLRKK